MIGIYIKGMEMPEEGYHHTITIYSDGTVATGRANDYEAISVPHKGKHDILTAYDVVAAPTIIPASEEEK